MFSDALFKGKSLFESGEDTVTPIPASFATTDAYFHSFIEAVMAEAKCIVRQALLDRSASSTSFRVAITDAGSVAAQDGSGATVPGERVPGSASLM